MADETKGTNNTGRSMRSTSRRNTDSTRKSTSRRQESSSGSLEDLREYSKNLSESAKAVKSAAEYYNKSVKLNKKNTDATVNKLHKTLSDFSKSFGSGSLPKLGKDSSGGGAGNTSKDISQVMKDATEEFDETCSDNLSNAQKLIGTLEKVFMRIANYFIGKFETGFNKVLESYNSYFTATTSRLDQTARDYGNMLHRVTKNIKGLSNDFIEGLDKYDLTSQFSQVDFQESLISVLETGIRGGTAEEMAYYDMISKRLLPMLNTNTRAYTMLSKRLGDSFREGITAIGLYTEKVYGAEGLENGGIEEVLNSMGRDILVAAKEMGLSETEATGIIQGYVDQYNKIYNTIGDAAARNYLDTVKGMISGDTTNLMGMEIFDRLNLNYADTSSILGYSPAEIADLLQEIYADKSKTSQMMNIMSTQVGYGGMDSEAAKEWFAGGYGRGATGTEEPIEVVTYDAVHGFFVDAMEELENGKYQNATAQQEKRFENSMADIATEAGRIPDAIGLLDLIKGIAGDIFGLLLTWKVGDMLGGSGKLLGKLTGVGGGAGGATGGGSALSLGGGAIGKATGGTGVTALGGVVGGAMIAGGLIWGAADYFDARNRMKESGASDAVAREAGWRKAFTGNQTMTSKEKGNAMENALNGKSIDMDWGAVAKNAGKYALVGGGIGTFIGGGVGTAIGGAIGGLVGGMVSYFDQKKLKKRFDEIAAVSTKVAKSNTELKEANNKFKASLELSTSTYDSLNSIMSDTNVTADERRTLLENLVKTNYPQLADEMNNLKLNDEEYVKVLKTKIGHEQDLLAADSTEKARAAISAADNMIKQGYNKMGIGAAGQYVLTEMSKAMNRDEKSPKYGFVSRDDVNRILDEASDLYGLEKGTIVGSINRWSEDNKTGRIINEDSNGWFADVENGHHQGWYDAYHNTYEYYGTDESNYEAYRTMAKNRMDTFNESAFLLVDDLNNQVARFYDAENKKYDIPPSIISDLKEKYNKVWEYIQNYNWWAHDYAQAVYGNSPKDEGPGVLGENDFKMFDLHKEDFTALIPVEEALGINGSDRITETSFRSGAYYIEDDGLIAELHQGEMVLTRRDAEYLRSLSSNKSQSGVSDLLSRLSTENRFKDDYDSLVNLGNYSIDGELRNISIISDAIEELTNLVSKRIEYDSEAGDSLSDIRNIIYDNKVVSTNANEETSEQFDPIVNAITEQTEVLSKINYQILDSIAIIVRRLREEPPMYSEDLINFRNV